MLGSITAELPAAPGAFCACWYAASCAIWAGSSADIGMMFGLGPPTFITVTPFGLCCAA